MNRQVGTRTLCGVVTVLAIAGVAIVFLRVAELLGPLFGQPLPAEDSFGAGFLRWPGLTLLHTIAGLIFMVLGPLQFVAKVRSRHITLHRWCGRIYAAAALVIGVTALVMGLVIGFGGQAETTAVTVFSVLFLGCLSRALFHIRRREVAAHREWMIRAFALGLSVATMRPVMALFIGFSELSFAQILGIAFWLAFSLHLVLAELWIRFTRRAKAPARVTSSVQL